MIVSYGVNYFWGFLARGDIGLLPPKPGGTYFCFFSAGFRIWRMLALGPHGWMWSGMYLERAEQALVDAHHSTRVVELAAVVWCGKECDKLALREELVAILNDLMRTADEIHVVLLQEARYDVWAKRETDTSIVLTPPSDVFVGIGPQKIAQETAVGNLRKSVWTVCDNQIHRLGLDSRQWGASHGGSAPLS